MTAASSACGPERRPSIRRRLEWPATGLPAWKRGQPGQVGNEAAPTAVTSAGVRLVTFTIGVPHANRPPAPRLVPAARAALDRCAGGTRRRRRSRASHARRPLGAGERAAAVERHARRASASSKRQVASFLARSGARAAARSAVAATASRRGAVGPPLMRAARLIRPMLRGSARRGASRRRCRRCARQRARRAPRRRGCAS